MPKVADNDFRFDTMNDIKPVEKFTGGTAHDVYLCDVNDKNKCYCMVNIPKDDSFYQLKLYPGVHIIKSISGEFSTFPVSLKDAKTFKERTGQDLVFFNGGISDVNI